MESALPLRRLLALEYTHVKHSVKRALEAAATRAELPFEEATQLAWLLYQSERAVRVCMGDPLAQELEALRDSTRDQCPVADTLFSTNRDTLCRLVSHDPLVRDAEAQLRTTIETCSRAGRCDLDDVLGEYLTFVTPRASRAMHQVCLAGTTWEFPDVASWAAFLANEALWLHLVPHSSSSTSSSTKPSTAACPPATVARPPARPLGRWMQRATAAAAEETLVYIVAADLQLWMNACSSS